MNDIPAHDDIDPEDFAAAADRDESRARFYVVAGENDLQEILAAPLEQWRVFLHPAQRRLATRHVNGPSRILGGAGTGKTVLAMHRARHLAGTLDLRTPLTRLRLALEMLPRQTDPGLKERMERDLEEMNAQISQAVELGRSFVGRKAPFSVRADYMPEPRPEPEGDVKAYAMAIINTIKELLPLNPLYVEELKMFLDRFGPDDPSHLADFAASLTTSTKDQLQEVLEAVPLMKRMEKVLVLLNNELELARAQQKIRATVEERMHKQQREFFLKEQLKAIQKELGIAKDDRTAEADKFKQRLDKLKLTEEAQKRVDEELEKMSVLETGSPEYAVTRNYLDWITLLPWGVDSKDKLDLKRARRVLDRDHYGLDDVKNRILEFLAVGIHKGEIAGSIILLVGPPGVGKTSSTVNLAYPTNRKFVRMSLGGVRDEAEIRGHRRTYIGALPGKIIQNLAKAGSRNAFFLLDEIDKIGASYHGDPASALLEVLDPEQNRDFLDHYLDLRFDLSKVLFVCTANQTDSIPGPLLDRMEVIQLSGYIADEKLAIAKKYLLPRQLERAGLNKAAVKVGTKTLRALIEGYARDAGVRRLEKQLGKIVRKVAVRMLEGEATPIDVTEAELKDYLGSPVFRDERKLGGPGVVTGLAWTAKTGARGLRTIMEQVLLDIMYDLPSLDSVSKVVVDSSVIAGENTPFIIYDGVEQQRAAASD